MFRSKYRSHKTFYNGRRYDSKAESIVSNQLQLEQRAGEISGLEFQVQVELTDAKIIYKPDFKYVRKSVVTYGECKGFETAEWRIKRKLWQYYGPGPLEVYNVVNGRVILKEIINPKIVKNT